MKLWKVAYVTGAVATASLIAHSVRNGHTAEFDKKITRAIQTRKSTRFGKLMWLASWAGFPPQSRIIPLALPALFTLFGRRRAARFQLAGWGTSLISGTVKTLMQRPRPTDDEFTVHKANIGGTSFPSGHVINYVGVYGTLAAILVSNIRSSILRRLVVSLISVKLTLVGPSRIYLGHHWFTDVLTSYLLGSSYVIVLSSLYRRALRKD